MNKKREPRSENVTVRLTVTELKAIDHAAKLAGVSRSTYARDLMRRGSLDNLVASFLATVRKGVHRSAQTDEPHV